MDASQGKDNQGPTTSETASPKERIKKWIETGYTDDAIAAFGISVDLFLEMLRAGNVPFQPLEDSDNLPYRNELRKDGAHLYYFNILGENLKRKQPEFYRRLVTSDAWKAQPNNLTNKVGIKNAQRYARGHAFRDRISAITGKKYAADDIEEAIDEEIYEDLIKLYEEDKAMGRGAGTEKMLARVNEVKQTLASLNIDGEEIIKHKGIVIYFNDNIFNDSVATPGIEESDEFIVVSKKPLGFDTISGIEILSEIDLADLKKEYEI